MKLTYNYIKNLYGIMLLLVGLLAGCNEEKDASQGEGYIILGVDKNEILYTRAGEPVLDEVLGVYFIATSGDTIKQFENYKEEVEGQRILLPAGSYQIAVSSAPLNEPQWDTPVYYGDTVLFLTDGEVASASIECKITNTKVSVEFTENVAYYFSDYEAIVRGNSGFLTFGKDETRSGFYSTDELVVTLNLVNKNNGLNFQFQKVFPDIKPRHHYTLLFDTQKPGEGESSGGNIDVIINQKDSAEVEYIISIPEYTQLASMPDAPKAKTITKIGNEETIGSSLSFIKIEGENPVDSHKVTITSQAGLRNLYIYLSEGYAVGTSLPEIFDWFTVSNVIKNTLGIKAETSSPFAVSYTLDLTKMVNQYLEDNGNTNRTYVLQLSAVDVFQQEVVETITYTVRPNLSVMTSPINEAEVWATHATLRGFSDPSGTNIYFRYGTAGTDETTWRQSQVIQPDTEGNVEVEITGLTAATDYSYKLYATLNGDPMEGDVYNFTTEEPVQLPNSGFEEWYYENNATWRIFAQGDAMFWDSGNEGTSTGSAAILGGKNPTQRDNTVSNSGTYSAKLQSQYVGLGGPLGKFAAGNIFTGKYVETLGTAGGLLDWGREFTTRPAKLTGWYKYDPVEINYVENYIPADLVAEGAVSGAMDKAHIYIALLDWESSFLLCNAYPNYNSYNFNLFDKNDPSVIAYGEFVASEATEGAGMHAFEINLQYNYTDKKPTYILVVGSASKYGDYFTGGDGSILWLDHFELVYE